MTGVLTLEARKRARVGQIREGFAALREELARYARVRGGRFLVYGSAATGRLHFDSDIDILVDFDDAGLAAALDFVEGACARLQLKPDVQPMSWCTSAFLDRILPGALVLP
jgi:predicted nucleotidyltransferase